MYASMLVEVGRLIYLIGNFSETSQLKKILESSDGKSKILYKCFEEVPPSTFEKIKHQNVREGIVRSDWISKMIDRYPQMIIFLFNCGDDSQDLQTTYSILREILKKINLFFANFLKQYGKEEVAVKIIVTLTRTQFSNPQIQGKVIYYLKTYEKDLFIIQNDLLGREIPKYRASWLSYLEKNYERKLKKIYKRLQESHSIDRRIGCAFKIAIMSEILCRDEKSSYTAAYNSSKQKFSQITKKDFNFLKFLQIRELRAIADTLVLRYIKFKIGVGAKEIPQFVYNHLNFFKMRSMDPNSCHFYYYYEELLWRSRLIEHLLEAFYESEVIDLLSKVFLAEIINGLLSYLHKMATIDENILKEINGKPLNIVQQIYLGKANYLDITDADLVATGINYILKHRKDYIQKGIQIVSRYKELRIFKENQINFLNIYLIRFYLAEGRFSAFIEIYHQILKVEMNRCNYFLINELFSEIKGEMTKIDPASKTLLTGVASLICDYFENKEQLSNYLKQFYELLGREKPEEVEKKSLFANELAPQAHIFKLKKSSSILSAKVIINEQIIIGQSTFSIKVRLSLHEQLRSRMASGDKLKLKFNQPLMVIQMQLSGEEQVQFLIEPLKYNRKDAVLKVDEIQVEMSGKSVVWLLERSQIIFERFDATVLFCRLDEPQITINHMAKVYYLQETAAFQINIRGVQDCKITSRLKVFEEGDSGTQFFMNIQERRNLTGSKIHVDLQVSSDEKGADNICWLKCTRLGLKNLKLQFTNTVQRTLKVGWRQKPLTLKSSTTVVKQIFFTVSNLFSVGKIFRQAQTGALQDNNIPVSKKSLLSFYIKAIEAVNIGQLDSNNNRQPHKIKYYKGPCLSNVKLQPSENLKVNMLFQLDPICQDQFEIFLTTLIIKWSRVGSKHFYQNVHLEDIKVNSIADKLSITFEQQSLPLLRRQQSNLILRLQNLTNNQLSLRAAMQSSDNLLRIGERSKTITLNSREKGQINFEILGIHAGIFQFPPLKVFVNDTQTKISTANFLIYCG